jgi:hypothetical protein
MLTDWLANREIHKPSAVVSFGLPGPLSLPAHADAMVADDRGQTSTGKASGSGSHNVRLTLPFGGCTSAKRIPISSCNHFIILCHTFASGSDGPSHQRGMGS